MENKNAFIDQVQSDVRAYLKTCTAVGKLRIIGGLSRVLGLFLLLLTVVLLVFAASAFGAVAAIAGLSHCMPVWLAALIIGGVYLLLLCVAVLFRKQLFINPFVSLLSGAFFAEEGRRVEEQRLRKEAEND